MLFDWGNTDSKMRLDRRSIIKRGGQALLGAGVFSQNEPAALAQRASAKTGAAAGKLTDCGCAVAADGSPLDTGASELRPAIERYAADLRDLERVYGVPGSATRRAKLEDFCETWLRLLKGVNFEVISQPGKIDYLLLYNRLLHERKQLAEEAKREADLAPLVPFQQTVVDLEEARRRMDTLDARKAATALAEMTTAIAALKSAPPKAGPAVLRRATARVAELRHTLRAWYNFHDLYDPNFSWWVDAEFKKADEALEAYAQSLPDASGASGTLDAGTAEDEPREDRGDAARRGSSESGRDTGTARRPALGTDEELSGAGPVGNEVLVEAVRDAMIPYTPDELLALADKEFAWCDREMLRATREMGFGGDWKKALEAVKNQYVEPGRMIYLVRDLSREAIDYLKKHELVTIPPLLEVDYWEEAMTPQGQLVNPFFTGGATIHVSSPARTMTTAQKLESLRGNNIFFARATVFHELIPGHHMQGYMTRRYRPYRSIFSGPFWTEGLAFYWEMLLWDLGFTHTPEQRVGALFWRMHRCARIIFSLSFHLGRMTATQAVAFLVDRVGFEQTNAEGEVRRSFNGSYEPIYQCAYMLGALQFYALHKEFVDSGKMSNRAFHDAIYREGDIPVEILRLALTGQNFTRDYQTNWKFYGSVA